MRHLGITGQAAWALVSLALVQGCKKDQPQPVPTQATASPDRLSEGEVLPGRDSAFGLELPQGLKVAARYPHVVQMSSTLSREAVVRFFRENVLVQHVEVTPSHTLFPKVYIKGDKSKHIYRIDVTVGSGRTLVNMRDITPPPVTQGLTEVQRWEQAGRNPDGTQKNRNQIY